MTNEKKMIFFDIDGTLIDAKKEVSPSTKLALQQLKEAGHQVFICTGRTKCMLPKVITDLDFNGFVYGGGSGLEYENQLLHLQELTYDEIMYLTDLLNRYHISYVYEGHKNVFIEERFFQDKRAYFSEFIKTIGKVCISFDSYEEIRASKITCIYSAEFTPEKKTAFAAEIKDNYHVIFHEKTDDGILTDGLVEILPKGCTKGYGIEKLVTEMHRDMKETVGVGDSNNDLEMLEVVDMAICMGNGSKQAKERADFITRSVNEDGIMYAVKTLGYI